MTARTIPGQGSAIATLPPISVRPSDTDEHRGKFSRARLPSEPHVPRGDRSMTLTRDHLRRIVAVAHARNLRFVELAGLAELDPAMAFRGAVIRGADLSGQDLAGFDFTGASFIGCDLRGADLSRTLGVTQDMLERANTDGKT